MREVYRKLFHLAVGLGFIILAIYIERAYSVTVLQYIIFAVLVLTLLHNIITADLGIKEPFFQRFLRDSEGRGFHGGTHYLLGVLIAITFFPFDIALAAVSMLIFGDAMAALIGQRWGRKIYKDKSIHGTLAMLITSIACGAYFLTSWPIIIAMAVTATIIEVLTSSVDDNLMIPIFAGVIGWGMRLL